MAKTPGDPPDSGSPSQPNQFRNIGAEAAKAAARRNQSERESVRNQADIAAAMQEILEKQKESEKLSRDFAKVVKDMLIPDLKSIAHSETFTELPKFFNANIAHTSQWSEELNGVIVVFDNLGHVAQKWKLPKKGLFSEGAFDIFSKGMKSVKKQWTDAGKTLGGNNWIKKVDEQADAAKGFKRLGLGSQILVAGTVTATAAMTGLGGILDLVKKAFFATWDYIDTKVLPTTSMLNKALGTSAVGMGQLRKQAMATGNQFQDLGLGFEQGAQDVAQLATSMKTATLPTQTIPSLLKMTEYVGLGAEQTGQLALQFVKAEGSITNLDGAMKTATVTAKEYGIPVNIIRKEMGENIDTLQRFGTANVSSFRKAIGVANSYGLSIKQVDAAFGKSMDTFEATSDVAAKLNTTFGTSINSLQLMQETDPSKRLQMVSKSLSDVGKDWQKLTVFERNAITSTLGVDNATAALALSSGDMHEKLQAQARATTATAKTNEDWEKGLSSLRKHLVDTGQQFSFLWQAVGNVVAKLLGFNNGAEMTTKGVGLFKAIIQSLTAEINKVAAAMPKSEHGFSDMVNWAKSLANSIQAASKSISDITNNIENMLQPYDGPRAERFAKQFEMLSKAGDMEGLSHLRSELAASGQDTMDLFHKKLSRAGVDDSKTESVLDNAVKGAANQKNVAAGFKNGAGVPSSLSPNLNLTVPIHIDGKKVAEAIVGIPYR